MISKITGQTAYDTMVPDTSERFTCRECSVQDFCLIQVGENCDMYVNPKYEIIKEEL